MRINNRIIITLFVLTTFINCYSQNCSVEKKNNYVIFLNIAEDREPGYVGILMIDDLVNLQIDKTNKMKFICTIYSNTKYITNPYFSYVADLMKCYGDSSNFFFELEYQPFCLALEDMTDICYSISFKLNDSSFVRICIIKINAEYWTFLYENKLINDISGQMFFPDSCFADDYIYSFKKISDIEIINKKEKEMISKILKY